MKKSQYRKVVKIQKWQNLERGSMPKKQRLPELGILVANQEPSLLLKLEKPLSN